jgi:hypothetical protein
MTKMTAFSYIDALEDVIDFRSMFGKIFFCIILHQKDLMDICIGGVRRPLWPVLVLCVSWKV